VQMLARVVVGGFAGTDTTYDGCAIEAENLRSLSPKPPVACTGGRQSCPPPGVETQKRSREVASNKEQEYPLPFLGSTFSPYGGQLAE
jgi:hypothetical protein